MKVLSLALPNGYIFQVDNKKKDKSHPKKKNPEELLLSMNQQAPKAKVVQKTVAQTVPVQSQKGGQKQDIIP